MRNVNMKILKKGVMEYKTKINKLEEKNIELEQAFQEEEKKRDDILDKESSEFKLQEGITQKALEELQQNKQKINYLKTRIENTINVVKRTLENDKKELDKKALELQDRKRDFEKEKKYFENLISINESNPIIYDNDKNMENRRRKVQELDKEIIAIELKLPEIINDIAEIDNKLQFIDYDNIENYQLDKEVDGEEEKVEKDKAEKEKAEKAKKEQEEKGNEQENGEDISSYKILIDELTNNVYSNVDNNEFKISEALEEKSSKFNRLNIKKICKEITGKRISSILLYRKVNPAIIKALENNQDLMKSYISAIYNKEKLPFELKYNLQQGNIFKKFKLKKYIRTEEKLGAIFAGKNVNLFNTKQNIEEDEYKKMIDDILDELDNDKKMIDDILDKLDNGEISFEEDNNSIPNEENKLKQTKYSERERFAKKVQEGIDNSTNEFEKNAIEKTNNKKTERMEISEQEYQEKAKLYVDVDYKDGK